MTHFVFLLSLAATALACAPAAPGGGGASPPAGGASPPGGSPPSGGSPPAAAGGGGSPPAGGSPPPGGRRKRSAERVQLTMVSKENFDTEMNPTYLAAFKSAMEEHAKTLGYEIPTGLQEEVRNVAGKFSVFYDIPSAYCDQMKTFMEEVKDKTHMLEVVRIKCANGEQYLIH